MSGYKTSQIAIEWERAQRLRLLTGIQEVQARLRGLVAQMERTLARTPAGVKAAFGREVDTAQVWVSEAERQGGLEATMDSTSGDLRSTLRFLNGLARQGEQALETLVKSVTQKAAALEKSLAARMAQVESKSHGYRELFQTWFGPAEVERIEGALARADRLLEQKALAEVGPALDRAEETLQARSREAQELEEKHQKRLYVLKALRQVCAELGFEETEPRYEGQDKRGSIVYEVDTLDRGKVVFHLTLEGVSADSAIVEDKCHSEFDQLSERLQQEFGVQTRFRREGEQPQPKLIRRGEADLPGGAQAEKGS